MTKNVLFTPLLKHKTSYKIFWPLYEIFIADATQLQVRLKLSISDNNICVIQASEDTFHIPHLNGDAEGVNIKWFKTILVVIGV